MHWRRNCDLSVVDVRGAKMGEKMRTQLLDSGLALLSVKCPIWGFDVEAVPDALFGIFGQSGWSCELLWAFSFWTNSWVIASNMRVICAAFAVPCMLAWLCLGRTYRQALLIVASRRACFVEGIACIQFTVWRERSRAVGPSTVFVVVQLHNTCRICQRWAADSTHWVDQFSGSRRR